MRLRVRKQFNDQPRTNKEERIVQAKEVRQRADARMLRLCTVFGYRHGGYTTMLAWIGLVLLMPSMCVGGFVLFATQDVMRAVKFDIWFWGIPASLVVTTALLFIFLKPRYALSAVWALIGMPALIFALYAIYTYIRILQASSTA